MQDKTSPASAFLLKPDACSPDTSSSPTKNGLCSSSPELVSTKFRSSWSDIVRNGGFPSSSSLKYFPPLNVDGEAACISPPPEHPKPLSCVDAVINVVESPGSYVVEKSLAGDLGVAPTPVSHSVNAGPGIRSPVPDSEPGCSDAVGMGLHKIRAPPFDSPCGVQSFSFAVPPECKLNLPAVDFQVSRPHLQHVDQTCSLGGFPAVVVDSNSTFSNSTGPIESHLEGLGCNAGENRDIESDPNDNNSQSSEEWTAEVIAKDPMHYALRCLLGENASQLHFNSITKDQRGVLFDFIYSRWSDVSENLDAVWDAVLPVREPDWGVPAVAEAEFTGLIPGTDGG
ncbi:hypothetical protein Nepgr_024018 [Nepenthes gracilis]|uniref:Uncharacterized protein n=1 Tax=Nepenthes gracilis TaxID=150966 RepID=A0AAD3T2E6_NEPGR|nr:hypothetical protein Nepgr_024018 [Nepenthes gracilis]